MWPPPSGRADDLRHQAEDYAKRLVNEDAIVREAEKQADEILAEAEEQCRMLRAAASEYCEDTLRRMEEAVADAYDEVKRSRQSSALSWGQTTAAPPLGASPPPVGPCTTQRPTRTKTNKQQGVSPLTQNPSDTCSRPGTCLGGCFSALAREMSEETKRRGGLPKPPVKREKKPAHPKNSCFLQGRNL